MKTIIIGAAGLLLSGTALAGVATNKGMSDATTAIPVAAKDADGLGASLIGNAITIDWPSKAIETGRAFDAKRVADAAKASAQTQPEAATAEAPSTSEMSDVVVATDVYDGVGGPDENMVATAAAAPAASYRACAPGPGDDNCIQLYEPGVAESYAAYQASGGMPGTEQTAMGGPDDDDAELAAYEPLPEDAVMPASEDDVDKDAPDTMAL